MPLALTTYEPTSCTIMVSNRMLLAVPSIAAFGGRRPVDGVLFISRWPIGLLNAAADDRKVEYEVGLWGIRYDLIGLD